jgi:hypothetical protein
MVNKIHVYFAVFDFGSDPTIVTKLVGIEPTQSWVKGGPMPNHPQIKATHSRWAIHSPLAYSAGVEKHLEALLPILESHATGIHRATAQYRAAICCAIYFEDFNPSIVISESIVSRIAKLGLSIEFDLYFLGVDESETHPAQQGVKPTTS